MQFEVPSGPDRGIGVDFRTRNDGFYTKSDLKMIDRCGFRTRNDGFYTKSDLKMIDCILKVI